MPAANTNQPSVPPPPTDELAELTQPQLRAEIARLEAMLQGWTGTMLPTLRRQVEESIQMARRELSGRKTTGRTLDQAEGRHRQTQKATQLAEDQLKQAQEAVELAQIALRRAKNNEATPLAELNRLKASIAEMEAPLAPPRVDLPPQVLAGVYAVLQHAGLQPQYLDKVGSLLGAPLPPLPPAHPGAPPPETLQPASGMGDAQLPSQPQQRQEAPPPAQGVLTQMLKSPSAERTGRTLRHNEAVGNRQTRSLGRRPLPRRSDLADYAETMARSSSRETSRTPGRASKAPHQRSPASSLHGVAPGNPSGPLTPTQPCGTLQPLAAAHPPPPGTL